MNLEISHEYFLLQLSSCPKICPDCSRNAHFSLFPENPKQELILFWCTVSQWRWIFSTCSAVITYFSSIIVWSIHDMLLFNATCFWLLNAKWWHFFLRFKYNAFYCINLVIDYVWDWFTWTAIVAEQWSWIIFGRISISHESMVKADLYSEKPILR